MIDIYLLKFSKLDKGY